jgi:acetolactate synthase-1/2/3 large subunit
MSQQRTAAIELATILYDEGISHLFLNPGMFVTPLREALAEIRAAGMALPQPVLCGHEHLALSAAHGHHLVGGGPQVVMVHVAGGRLQLAGALENARRDRVPVAVLAGGGPPSEVLESSAPLPAEPVGKWHGEVRNASQLGPLLRRGLQIARTEPTGPIHLVVPPALFEEPVSYPSRRLPSPRAPVPDLGALEEMAELLAAARSPLIVAGRVGRNLSAVPNLARLAETLGAPVIDFRNCVNLPPQHALNAGLEGRDLLLRADAILLLDVEAACVPGLGPFPTQAWLLQIDSDCLKPDVPGWCYPVEIGVTADTAQALPHLVEMLSDRLSNRRWEVEERRQRIIEFLAASRQAWHGRATSGDPDDFPDALLAELNRALPEDVLVLEEAAANADAAIRQLERPPGRLFRWATASPGWSIGAALGARLADPTRPVVALCDDPAFDCGLPTAAFRSAHRFGAAFLTVVLSRGGHRPSRSLPGGGLQDASDPVLEAGADPLAVARASGAEGMAIESPAQVAAAVERLLASTRDGVCAVLQARLPRP